MAGSRQSDGGGGCIGLIALLMLIAGVVMAVISFAALVDPFDWMPRVSAIWADCEGDCALAHRFPGFWWHAAANLAYVAVAAGLAGAFLASVKDVRDARVTRFDGAHQHAAFESAHDQCVGSGALLGVLGALPIVAAIL